MAAGFGNQWYAHRSEWMGAKYKTVLMHRVIMDAPKGMDVDHINGNGLDNRKENLRICTRSQNLHNSKKPSTNTSGYKGVIWNKQCRKWQAKIHTSGKTRHLGLFVGILDAARAYDEAAVTDHREFARGNFAVESA